MKDSLATEYPYDMPDMDNIKKFEPKTDWKNNARVNERRAVELGRKLGSYEKRFGKMRNEVTETCAAIALISPGQIDSAIVKSLRNTVRIMKGKNPWK